MDLSEEEIKIQLAQIELREKQRKEEEKVKKQAEKVKNDQEKKRKQEEKVQKELERIRVKEMKAEKKKIEDQRREEAKLEKERLKEINKKLKEEKEKKKKEEEMVKIQTDLEKLEVKHLEMRLKAQMKRQEFIKSMAEDDEPNYLATNENDDGTKISDSDDSDSDVLGKKEIENKHNLTDDIGIDLEKIVVEDIPDDEYNSDESKNAVSRSGGKGPPQDRGGYKVLCVSALHPKASSDVVRDTLYRVFKKYGDISVMVMHESDERVAYVYFRSFEDARDAKHSKSRIILFDKPTMVEAVYESACREEYGSGSGGLRPRSLSPPRYGGGGGSNGRGDPGTPDRNRDDSRDHTVDEGRDKENSAMEVNALENYSDENNKTAIQGDYDKEKNTDDEEESGNSEFGDKNNHNLSDTDTEMTIDDYRDDTVDEGRDKEKMEIDALLITDDEEERVNSEFGEKNCEDGGIIAEQQSSNLVPDSEYHRVESVTSSVGKLSYQNKSQAGGATPASSMRLVSYSDSDEEGDGEEDCKAQEMYDSDGNIIEEPKLKHNLFEKKVNFFEFEAELSSESDAFSDLNSEQENNIEQSVLEEVHEYNSEENISDKPASDDENEDGRIKIMNLSFDNYIENDSHVESVQESALEASGKNATEEHAVKGKNVVVEKVAAKSVDQMAKGKSMDTSNVTLPEDDCRLFVSVFPENAKQDDISDHFQTFGEIDNIIFSSDPEAGSSKAPSAFVRFKTAGGLKATFATEEHAVKGKTFDVKKLPAKPGKIYVGKIKAELSNMEIKSHFAQFGPIAKVEQPFDKSKKERKDFCFITFVKEDSAELLLKAGTTTVNGIELEVKKVTPKPDPRAKGMMGMDRGEKGGYGGGYEYRDPYAIHGGGGGYGGNSGGWLGFDQYVAKMGARGMRPRGAGQWGARGGRGRGVARYEPYQP